MGTVGPVPSAGLDVTALGLTVTRVVAFPTELLENERTLESKACNSEWTCWANWIKFCVLVTGMSNMSMVRREFIDLFIADMHNNIFFTLAVTTPVSLSRHQMLALRKQMTNVRHLTQSHMMKLLCDTTIPKTKKSFRGRWAVENDETVTMR